MTLHRTLIGTLRRHSCACSNPALVGVFSSHLRVISLNNLASNLRVGSLLGNMYRPHAPHLTRLFTSLNLYRGYNANVRHVVSTCTRDTIDPRLHINPASITVMLPVPMSTRTTSSRQASTSTSTTPDAASRTRRTGVCSFPAVRHVASGTTSTLTNTHVVNYTPLRALVLNDKFNRHPSNSSRTDAHPLSATALRPSPRALRRFALGFLTFHNIGLDHGAVRGTLNLGGSRVARLLSRLRLDNGVRHRARTGSAACSLTRTSKQ